jgi:hypothetical protein
VPVGIDCLIHKFIGQAYLQFTFHQNYAVVIYTPTITYFVIAYRINHYSLQVYPPSCFSQNHRETIYILLGRSIHDFDGMMRHPKNVGNKACRRHPPNRMRNKVANAFHGPSKNKGGLKNCKLKGNLLWGGGCAGYVSGREGTVCVLGVVAVS